MRKPVTVPARVLSVRPAGSAAVYNLTVEGESEYFANGVLVHNCDVTAYAALEAVRFTESTGAMPEVFGGRGTW